MTIKKSNYRMPSSSKSVIFLKSFAGICLMTISAKGFGQTADGNAGINQANTFVRGYFDSGVNLVYAIGALVGLIGAVKVYQKWNHGDHDTGKVAAAWFGSCIFLVIVATVLKSFFGL
jgi:hypothetical protein